MCGIAGICGSSLGDGTSSSLDAMLAIMAHRGPDDEGTWVDPRRECALGHRRLAIIDPVGGSQPLSNEDETIWITFNGCIYNYLDLGRILRQKGHVFRTNCDTEVIVHAYEEWGIDCVSRFNGMWAFALWDSSQRSLFCSRDRIGVKPFYYSCSDHDFIFSSEIKALLTRKDIERSVSPEGLRQYLTFQYCLGDTTLFNGIKRLQPGHSIVVRPGMSPQLLRYWDLSFNVDTEHDESFFIDKLDWLLQDSVRLRLRSDVPLGAHLSGGLDSSTVVGLARLLLEDSPIKTFTGFFPEGMAFDERIYAKGVSEAAGTEYHEICITQQHFIESIEIIIWNMDEPAAGPGVFPQYWVSKLASEHVKVILGGQGGDEIFIGYARYLMSYLEECLKGAIENTAHTKRYVATLQTITESLTVLREYVPMLKHFWQEGLFDEPTHRYFRLIDRFSDSRAFINRDIELDSDRTFEEFSTIFNVHGSASMINRIYSFDVKNHLQALLHVEDRTSMAWGLESRAPLLDYRLLEFMASIPPVIKFRNGQLKCLLRHAARNLVPSEVLNRKDKMGFPVPLNKWIRGDLRQFVHDILVSKTCRERNILDINAIERSLISQAQFSRGIWGALCLELWHRQFLDA